MFEYLQANESTARLSAFAGMLLIILVAERFRPRRPVERRGRAVVNLILAIVNTLVLRLCFPLLAVGMAVVAAERGWGVFSQFNWPAWLEWLLVIVLLDMIIYWQHRLMHAVPLLWRLHRMHHSDLAFDVTTGVRFHPVEIIFSMVVKIGAVVVLGASPVAVILFEILLSTSSLFEHGNLRLPRRLDRGLRLFIVTPDMHRVHHSVFREETDSNFGFNLSVWDRLFGSYRAQPRDGHTGMQIGLPEFRNRNEQHLLALLAQPLK